MVVYTIFVDLCLDFKEAVIQKGQDSVVPMRESECHRATRRADCVWCHTACGCPAMEQCRASAGGTSPTLNHRRSSVWGDTRPRLRPVGSRFVRAPHRPWH